MTSKFNLEPVDEIPVNHPWNERNAAREPERQALLNALKSRPGQAFIVLRAEATPYTSRETNPKLSELKSLENWLRKQAKKDPRVVAKVRKIDNEMCLFAQWDPQRAPEVVSIAG